MKLFRGIGRGSGNPSLWLLALCLTLGVASPAEAARHDKDEKEAAAEEISPEALLNTKVSTAAKYEQPAGEAPASISKITKEDIELYGYETLDEVLSTVPGFYTSYDRNYSFPYSAFSVYAQDEFYLNKKTALTGGVRYDRYSQFGGFAVPRLGIAYHPHKNTSLKLTRDKPEININLVASKVEGADFSSSFLKLARVIR